MGNSKLASILIVFVIGCGGRVGLDDYPLDDGGAASSSGPSGGASSGSASGSSSSGAASSSSGASGTSGGSSSGTSGGSSGTSTSGGSSGVVDAGPPPAPIACGQTTCSSATQICCVQFNPGGGGSETCAQKGTTCQGLTLNCSDAASCPSGDVCCFEGTGGPPTASCQPMCQGFNSGQLCSTDAECRGQRRHCVKTPGGFGICQRR